MMLGKHRSANLQEDRTFQAKYMGCTSNTEPGVTGIDKAVKKIHDRIKNDEKTCSKITVEVTKEGMTFIFGGSHKKQFFPIKDISYCSLNRFDTNIFAFNHHISKSLPKVECHAVLCNSEAKARAIGQALYSSYREGHFDELRKERKKRLPTVANEDDSETTDKLPTVANQDDSDTTDKLPTVANEDDSGETIDKLPTVANQDDSDTTDKLPTVANEDDSDTTDKLPTVANQDDSNTTDKLPTVANQDDSETTDKPTDSFTDNNTDCEVKVGCSTAILDTELENIVQDMLNTVEREKENMEERGNTG